MYFSKLYKLQAVQLLIRRRPRNAWDVREQRNEWL